MKPVLILRKEQIRALNAIVAGGAWKGGALLIEHDGGPALSIRVTSHTTGAVWRIDARGRTSRLRSPHRSHDESA